MWDNFCLKLLELKPIGLFHKVNCLSSLLSSRICGQKQEVFADKYFLSSLSLFLTGCKPKGEKLIIEKDFDEGYTLNGKYNEMAHVAAVK